MLPGAVFTFPGVAAESGPRVTGSIIYDANSSDPRYESVDRPSLVQDLYSQPAGKVCILKEEGKTKKKGKKKRRRKGKGKRTTKNQVSEDWNLNPFFLFFLFFLSFFLFFGLFQGASLLRRQRADMLYDSSGKTYQPAQLVVRPKSASQDLGYEIPIASDDQYEILQAKPRMTAGLDDQYEILQVKSRSPADHTYVPPVVGDFYETLDSKKDGGKDDVMYAVHQSSQPARGRVQVDLGSGQTDSSDVDSDIYSMPQSLGTIQLDRAAALVCSNWTPMPRTLVEEAQGIPCYQGALNRLEAETELRNAGGPPGLFLLRNNRQQANSVVLSLYLSANRFTHHVLDIENGCLTVDSKTLPIECRSVSQVLCLLRLRSDVISVPLTRQFIDAGSAVDRPSWLHVGITRSEAESRLSAAKGRNGTFLVRESSQSLG